METKEALRFAHPFFTTVPHEQREAVGDLGTRMTDAIKQNILAIPEPKRTPPVMQLSEVIGSAGVTEIENAGSIIFHSTGDTGYPGGTAPEMVSNAMTTDYDISHPETSPAFYFHLGDVDYYDNTPTGYAEQFYKPYKTYPGKIIAIPGNHDGELFKYNGTPTGQTEPCGEFMANFCQPVTGIITAGTIMREMISQPGVYWLLQCPFVDIIGLYSNMAENPGYIVGPNNDTSQKDWLQQTLTGIITARGQGTRKALIIAVHHPPFSTGAHSSSTEMLADIDDACTNAGIMPDAVLAAHSHNFQRYTRYLTFGGKNMQIPFFVCGCGGRPSENVQQATGARTGDHSYDKSLKAYGYLKITIDPNKLRIQFFEVNDTEKQLFDDVTVDLQTSQMLAH
jgi:hypothetical protein